MAFPDKAAKKASDHIPWAKDQGIDHFVAAGAGGVGLQAYRVAQVGASPFTFTFATYGLKNMADATYNVIVQGPNGDERADYATRTTSGFQITGGAAAEQLIVLVIGRIANQSL